VHVTGVVASSVLLALSLLASQALATELEQAKTFDECDAMLRERATLYECHLMLAQRDRAWSDGIRHLEARLALDPEDHESRLALGALREAVSDPQGDDDLRQAADGLAARGGFEAEGLARLALFYTLGEQGRLVEAERALRRAEQALASCGSPVLVRQLEYYRGLDAQYHHDYALALVHFKNAGALAEAQGDSRLRAKVLNGLGMCALSTGQPGDALEDFRHSAEIYHASGNSFSEASVLYNVCLAASQAGWPVADQARLCEQALAAARSSGNLKTEAKLLFGKAQNQGSDRERLAMLKQALAVAHQTRDSVEIGYVMRYTAHLLSRGGPAGRREAETMLDDAIEQARRSGDLEQVARGRIHRATILQDAGERDRALAEWNSTLDALESLRDFQRDDAARAGLQSAWAFLYYRVAAFALQAPGPGASPGDVEKALRVIERMRARVLLESLDAAGVATGGGPGDLQRRRAAALDGISRVQRRLLSPLLSDVERAAGLSELEALENRERALRAEMARADPSFASLRTPSLATIARIQETLQPDQALLSFQSDIDSRNPGWALAISRDAARTAAIPNRAALDNEVSLFLGMLERRDGSDAAGAARLYKDLLADLLQGLPAKITRLVIVPDGPLHGLPFDALRQDAAGGPLATRFEIALAPSCSAWLHFTGTERSQAEHPVLVMADPRLHAEEGTSASRAATIATGLRLGSLPSAREEAGWMVRSLGGGSRMVAGKEASERFLKTTDLASYRMLHLAAHAVVDEKRPERSAVLLAPGSDDEDGLLQAREVVNLDLKGRIVILSACSSASGTVLEGEGVMGLARAFFQAGAVGVVGGLWPLRDREAARLVDDMAIDLGRGASIGAALAGARREAIRTGAPAAAWAGLVLLGDGNFIPLPGGRPPERDLRRIAAIAVLLALAAGGLMLARRRRAQRSADGSARAGDACE
jgi:CHAT domain-containing protein